MEIYTVGFTKKPAAQFFGSLRQAGIHRLLDVRLNNTSQLAGFTKKENLPFFLWELCRIEYRYEPVLAPTQELFVYKRQKGKWSVYEQRFFALMRDRRIEERIEQKVFDRPTVLLCSEATAEYCHRRLIVEYLQSQWGNIQVIHL